MRFISPVPSLPNGTGTILVRYAPFFEFLHCCTIFFEHDEFVFNSMAKGSHGLCSPKSRYLMWWSVRVDSFMKGLLPQAANQKASKSESRLEYGDDIVGETPYPYFRLRSVTSCVFFVDYPGDRVSPRVHKNARFISISTLPSCTASLVTRHL